MGRSPAFLIGSMSRPGAVLTQGIGLPKILKYTWCSRADGGVDILPVLMYNPKGRMA